MRKDVNNDVTMNPPFPFISPVSKYKFGSLNLIRHFPSDSDHFHIRKSSSHRGRGAWERADCHLKVTSCQSQKWWSICVVKYFFLRKEKKDKSMEAEAKYRFAASQEDELSFEKGTIVNVRTFLESFSSNEFYFARSSSIAIVSEVVKLSSIHFLFRC